MAQVLLHHHVLGLTDGVRAFADEVRRAGHTVHTPDLFEGRTFTSIEDGFAYARERGLDALHRRGLETADGLGPAVHAGFSFGAAIAQHLAQTRPDALGALLLYSCLPVSEYGTSWPDGVPVQIHGKEGDEFFDEDLPAARDLVEATPGAEMFLYPGEGHLFADASSQDHDPEAAAVLMKRVLAFLARV